MGDLSLESKSKGIKLTTHNNVMEEFQVKTGGFGLLTIGFEVCEYLDHGCVVIKHKEIRSWKCLLQQ